MEFLEELVTNGELMFLYEIISFLMGFIFMINDQRRRIWYNISVYSICFVNAFFWGSLLFLRIFCSKWLFLFGGFAGMLLTLMFFKLKKESINYLFYFWGLVKVCLICFNFSMNDYVDEKEENLFLLALFISLIIVGIIIIVFLILKRVTGRWKNINGLHRICDLFYGSCLITGGIYEFIYDVSTREAKFLGDKKGYIHIYKALLKVDWTEDGTGAFFAGLCIFIIIAGGLYQYLYSKKIRSTNGDPLMRKS